MNKKDKADFDALTEALSLMGHYKNYRETLKTLPASTPCIPLIRTFFFLSFEFYISFLII